MSHLTLSIGFAVVITIMLVLDLGVFHRKAHVVQFKEAMLWSMVWLLLALLFGLTIVHYRGHESGLNFFTGYLLEQSLSVDNLFVFLLIFSYFRVPSHFQHKVLFWGILGAMIMRILFIAAGVALIHRFEWIMYIFGAFLIYTGFKLAFEEEKEIHPENNPILKIFRKFIKVSPDYEGQKFWVRKNGELFATPLLIVLLIVETTDVIFALDSIPAILAITTDPFIVYTSNIFAILGLRSLYFLLSGLMRAFRFLNYGVAVILAFVGLKMLVSFKIQIPIGYALGFIVLTLAISVLASITFPQKEKL